MLKENALKGKVAVVTGGGTGLGKTMASHISALGGKVLITGRRKEIVEETAAEIKKLTGNEVAAFSCDIRNFDEVEKLLLFSENQFGKVDILLNNAAGNFISPTERLSHRAFHIILDIVLKGTVNCTLAFGKSWIAKKQKGVVLSITTTYGETGSGYVVPSACAKAGVIAMTRSLAVEWAKYGIRFHAISPGPIPTKGAWERLLPGNLASKIDLAKHNPLGRVGKHEELGNLASYLVSDFAEFMNGEVVKFDGGEWLKGAGEFNFLDNITTEEWNEVEKAIRKK